MMTFARTLESNESAFLFATEWIGYKGTKSQEEEKGSQRE